MSHSAQEPNYSSPRRYDAAARRTDPVYQWLDSNRRLDPGKSWYSSTGSDAADTGEDEDSLLGFTPVSETFLPPKEYVPNN